MQRGDGVVSKVEAPWAAHIAGRGGAQRPVGNHTQVAAFLGGGLMRLEWTPSHMNVLGNEEACRLAEAG